MMAGHFATALIAYQRIGIQNPENKNSKALFFFLAASQLPDLLWVVFHFIGLEPTEPTSILDMTIKNLTVDMVYSHDLIPTLFWTGVLYITGRLIFKSHTYGLLGATLLLTHIFLDYLAGYPHHIFGTNSPAIGFPAYHSVPLLAVAIEAILVFVLLVIFFRKEKLQGIQRSFGNKSAIIGLFTFGIAFLTLVSNTSIREWFDLKIENCILFSAMPNLAFTYMAMLLFLFFVVRKK